MLHYKPNMNATEKQDFEAEISTKYKEFKSETDKDLEFRVHGVDCTRGSSGKRFAGYTTLSDFYSGDQWDHDEPPGQSQTTDNYCALIVDQMASLLYDAPVEINCPSQDETDDLLEMKAEIKERMLNRVYDDNDMNEIVLPELSKCGSLFGDCFLKGPLIDTSEGDSKDKKKIVIYNVDNPANIRPIFADGNYKKLLGFLDFTTISPYKATELYKNKLRDKGKSIEKLIKSARGRGRMGQVPQPNLSTQQTYQQMLWKSEFWTDEVMAIFLEDELVDWWYHNYKFVPLEFIKNVYVPNYPYGKSDLEDALDPQVAYNVTKNDLANALKFLSTINLVGKNLDGIEVLIHGLSKIFNLPEDGELEPLKRAGDPYASGNQVSDNRRAILDISGVSEALTSAVSAGGTSGRAMSMALQSVIRKINPKIKRHGRALKHLNKNIFKLMEMHWPETEEIIMGDYSNEVSIISTLLRNIIDELNKLQSGIQSLTTTQKNVGIPQPKIEQKVMKKDLRDPVLGPQHARQPGMLMTQIQSPEAGVEGTPGSEGQQNTPGTPNQGNTVAGPEGAAVAANQRASGGAAPPQVTP